MKDKLIFLLALISCSLTFGQSIKELYQDKNFNEIIKLESQAYKLSPEELYIVGFSFFQMEDDAKAIKFYDLALKDGLDSAFVHYDKAISLRYSKKFSQAIKSFDTAIQKNPLNQMYLSEKAYAYYYSGQLDSAIQIFQRAQKLPNDFQDPFYMVPHIHHLNMNYELALKGFYEALVYISEGHKHYFAALTDIGKLEYTITQNFEKSIEAYSKAIKIQPDNYELYPKLMKAYNAAGKFEKADSIFNIMRKAYQAEKLTQSELKFQNTAVAEYEWQGQKLTVYRYFEESEVFGDFAYKIYMLNKAGDKIERTFQIERTNNMKGGTKYLLCENVRVSNTHHTYLFGWPDADIPLINLMEAVIQVLEEND
ncbi:MAG: tetratricopeptide repeat protein [Bacteroidetes bacterium]|nr:tetratricopeptide repeat protein [Bacteroidota bacterium]